MTGKQNFIFFLGLTLIILNFVIGGQFKTLSKGIFAGPPNSSKGSSGSIGSPSLPIPTPFGLL